MIEGTGIVEVISTRPVKSGAKEVMKNVHLKLVDSPVFVLDHESDSLVLRHETLQPLKRPYHWTQDACHLVVPFHTLNQHASA